MFEKLGKIVGINSETKKKEVPNMLELEQQEQVLFSDIVKA